MRKIKRAKECFFRDTTNKKFFDFSSIDNIIGYSNKKLTHVVKNGLSSAWNIENNSIYHGRFESFIKKEFGREYVPLFFNSIYELFLYIKIVFEKDYRININSDMFNLFLEESGIVFDKDINKPQIEIIDYAYNTLFEKEIIAKENSILNYYLYPSTAIDIKGSLFTILPKIFSGNFSYVTLIIKQDSPIFDKLKKLSKEIPSLYLISSLKNIFLVREQEKLKKEVLSLESSKIIQKGRLFIFKDSEKENNNLSDHLYEKGILINKKAPYYNYLPFLLNEHQEKHIKKVLDNL